MWRRTPYPTIEVSEHDEPLVAQVQSARAVQRSDRLFARARPALMLNAILDRRPILRYDPREERPHPIDFGFRMLTGLPVF